MRKILLALLSIGAIGPLANARETSKPQLPTYCDSVLKGTVEMHCGGNGYKVDAQISKAAIVEKAGKNYREGHARVSFSGPDVLAVRTKSFDYSGDDWGITINVPGRDHTDYSQIVVMFKPGGGQVRDVSLIRDSPADGRKIIELTCTPPPNN